MTNAYMAYNVTKNGKSRQLVGYSPQEAATKILDWMRANKSRSTAISITEGMIEHGCFSCMIMTARHWKVAATEAAIATLPAAALEPVEG